MKEIETNIYKNTLKAINKVYKHALNKGFLYGIYYS